MEKWATSLVHRNSWHVPHRTDPYSLVYIDFNLQGFWTVHLSQANWSDTPPPPIEVNEVSELAGIEVGGCGKLTHLGLIAARRPLYFWTDTIPTVVYRRKTQYIYTIASSKNRCKGSKKAKIRSWMTTFEKEKQFQDFWILLVDAPPPRKNGTNLPSNSWNTHILCYNGGKKPPLRIKD